MNAPIAFPLWLRRLEKRVVECSSCRAPIRWGVTTSGKRMPIDADTKEGYTSHFATCPNAAKHRRET